jgi:uncharacterized membrane protein YsdA (DUF1294 family)
VALERHSAQGQVWRVSTAQRVLWVVALLGWLALTLAITIGGNKTHGAGASPTVLLWILFVVVALGAWRYGFIPYIEATATELVIRNAFTERHIPWTQIKTIKSGSIGLIVVTKEGGLPRTAWAVQKGRGARRTNMRTRADEVTAAVMEHVGPSASLDAWGTAT